MKIAVTSASGKLGSEIIKALLTETKKENICGIARTPEKASGLGVEIKKGDYNSIEDFEKALVGIETVLMVSGMDQPDKRIVQHRNVINAAKKARVKKIIYTSIFGKKSDSTFDAIIASNRQTEIDIYNSGLEWAIGRNGLYIEPDIEYIDNYKELGKISNSAGDGLCSYTTRNELAAAYTGLILHKRSYKTYNLGGEAISQIQLADYLNKTFGTQLSYEAVSTEEYLEFQKKTNGEFLGTVISGIYNKIRNGEFKMKSDYEAAAGRKHISWENYFENIKPNGL